jgi:hypothetical protein
MDHLEACDLIALTDRLGNLHRSAVPLAKDGRVDPAHRRDLHLVPLEVVHPRIAVRIIDLGGMTQDRNTELPCELGS